ncbi:MAG: ABC transporter substrate-binding protein [Campylobacterota bacterium]
MIRFWILFLLCAAFLHAQKPLERVSVQLQWADQFQFAGYYVAKEKGFYAEAGLDVAIRPFDPKKLAIDEVMAGRSEYGIGRSSLLVDRMRGKPVVALAAIFQSSPFVLLSAKSANIRSPRDLIGKRIMMTQDFQDTIAIRAMVNSQGMRMEELKFIEHSYNPLDIANGKADVMACYISNEPFTLREKGIETNALNPEQYGFDFYSDILFTAERELQAHPERVRAFVTATLKGWQYAFDHIEETATLIKTRYNGQNKSYASLVYEGQILKELAYRGNQPLGAMNLEKFRRISDIYKVMGIPQDEKRLRGFLYEDTSRIALPLSIEERSFLQMRTIRYTSTFSWPPFNYRSQDGALEGIAADFWALVVKRSGMQTRFSPASTWSGVLDAIKTKSVDVTLGTSISPDKEPYALFSKPYASFPNVIVTNKKIDFLPGLSALEGKNVAIGNGYGIADLIARKYPAIRIVGVDDTREGLKLLSSGRVDAVIDILPVVAFLMNEYHYVDLKISGTTEFMFDVRMMIRNDYPELKSIIDKGIDSITPAERQKIFNRYIAVTYEDSIDYRWVYGIALGALTIIALFMWRQFELGRYNRKLLEMASTDPLTQLPNRIRTDEKLAECHAYYERHRRPYAVIIIDIDWFKRINDTFGHLAGDKTLISIAHILRSHVRQTDTVGRWGGEEFIIVCPETDIEGARRVAEKLRSVINEYDFEAVHTLTCSFGISESRDDDRIEDIVGRADSALYRAKEEGRNRIVDL